MEEQEVDLGRTELEDWLDETVASHLSKWVRPEHLDRAVVVAHHEVNGALFINDHGLADHLASLADVHLLEVAVIFLEVGVVLLPLLLLLLVRWQREAQGQLPGRGDAIIDDSVVVLGDESHIETTN